MSTDFPPDARTDSTQPNSGHHPRQKRWWRLIRVFLILVISGVASSWLLGSLIVRSANCNIGDRPDDLPVTEFFISSENGVSTSGWSIEAPESRGVILLVHGIRSNRLGMYARAPFLHEAGYTVVLIDLQAHGQSPGQRITLGDLERENVASTIDMIKTEYPGQRTAVIGVSLGGAATLLAGPLDIDALILESVFPDIDAAVMNRVRDVVGPLAALPAWLLLMQIKPRLGISRSELRPVDHVADTGCPVFVMSGAKDAHTTPEETRKIFDAAASPKKLWLVPDTAHVDLHQAHSVEYERRVRAFLDTYLP